MNYDQVKIGYEFEFSAKMQADQIIYKLENNLDIRFSGLSKKLWYLTFDTSIKAIGSGYSNHELVSPPMPYNDSMIYLERIFNWMEQNKCKTNNSTGFHVNISFIKKSKNKAIDPIKLILFTPCDQVLVQYKRQKNTYCKSYAEDFRRWITYFRTENVTNWQDAVVVLHKRLMLSNDAKYRALSYHTEDGNIYVEFRMIGNKDYQKRISEIKQNIDEMIECLYISANKTACKIEFQRIMSEYLDLSQ